MTCTTERMRLKGQNGAVFVGLHTKKKRYARANEIKNSCERRNSASK